MKLAAIAFAVLAFCIGLRAAYLWHKASKVNVIPMWETDGRIEPVDIALGHQVWITAILKTAEKSGKLNREAAIWTAIAVLVSTLSSVIGAL